MKRKAIDELIKWKESHSEKPVLLTGAKGVGKTYLAYDFAKAFFKHIFYVQLNQNPLLKELFHSNDINRTKQQLMEHFHLEQVDPLTDSSYLNEKSRNESGILILDEIGYCEDAVKLVNEGQLSGLFNNIICISSNPIDEPKTDGMLHLTIYPLEFDEFLRATGNEWYIDLIHTHFVNNNKLPEIVHKELLELHRMYLKIGGMPRSVNEYLNFSSSVNVSEQHNLLRGSYHDCILEEYSESDALKMNQVFDSITHQLMKDNKKFQYKLIRKGTTHSMYKEAIQKLTDLNYVIRCNRINSEIFESKEFLDLEAIGKDPANTNFKIYLLDTGMLYSSIIKEGDNITYDCFHKALLENYVAQSLLAKHYKFVFWESDSIAKIDFIINKENGMIPIELHINSNTRSKSISVLKQKYEFSYAVKISSKNFELSNNIKYVPYYAVFCI